MGIEDVIRQMQEDNKRSRQQSYDQTRRLISIMLGESDETLDEILEIAVDDDDSEPKSDIGTDETDIDVPSGFGRGTGDDSSLQDSGQAGESSETPGN